MDALELEGIIASQGTLNDTGEMIAIYPEPLKPPP